MCWRNAATPGPMRRVAPGYPLVARQGLAALLTHAGIHVLASVGGGAALLREAALTRPDVVILDVRMPPSFSDEGIGTALALRQRFPGIGVLVLSTYAEPAWVRRLTGHVPSAVGYLLKDRVGNVERLTDALHTIAAGGIVIDEDVIARITPPASVLDRLTARQVEVLSLVAEGRSNQAISDALGMSVRTAEVHVAAILRDLDIPDEPSWNRRVLAALAYLNPHRGA